MCAIRLYRLQYAKTIANNAETINKYDAMILSNKQC